ncbi:hypothetical protein TNCT_689261 [Trichonephila clavata]|uniref:Uncharacterized protein n=1 Tax=Trichonephila clavata TaxID=2740835 RepID=A0A8X6KVF5_TRICU|nr:hypothetical protein TNCT_689261 [Trichonephila clavata]
MNHFPEDIRKRKKRTNLSLCNTRKVTKNFILKSRSTTAEGLADIRLTPIGIWARALTSAKTDVSIGTLVRCLRLLLAMTTRSMLPRNNNETKDISLRKHGRGSVISMRHQNIVPL